jgi:hypothetical protein
MDLGGLTIEITWAVDYCQFGCVKLLTDMNTMDLGGQAPLK